MKLTVASSPHIRGDFKTSRLMLDVVIALLPALAVGIAASSWVLLVQWGSFVTLLLSGILFFGSYLAMLLLLKEVMVKELLMQLLKKK